MAKMHYSWEQQEDFWNYYANKLANEAGLDEQKILESRQQLLVAFGPDWVKSQYENSSGKSKVPPNHGFGVVGMLTNPIINNAVGATELAKYLIEFRGQPNFQEIITKLKNPSDFEAIRLNLAFAYRLKKAGWSDVVVEPPLGDVQGKVGGKDYIVECSMISPPNVHEYVANRILTSLSGSLKHGKEAIGLQLTFKSRPSEEELNNLVSLAKKSRFDLSKTHEPQEFTTPIADGKVYEMTVEEANQPPDESGWDIVWIIEMGRPKRPGDVYSVDLDKPNKQTEGKIYINGLSEQYLTKTIPEQLEEKLRSKRKQTHSVADDQKRLFVFMSPTFIEKEDWEALNKRFKPTFYKRDNIGGIIFVDRRNHVNGGKNRYPYAQIHFLNNTSPIPELGATFIALEKFERSNWLEE